MNEEVAEALLGLEAKRSTNTPAVELAVAKDGLKDAISAIQAANLDILTPDLFDVTVEGYSGKDEKLNGQREFSRAAERDIQLAIDRLKSSLEKVVLSRERVLLNDITNVVTHYMFYHNINQYLGVFKIGPIGDLPKKLAKDFGLAEKITFTALSEKSASTLHSYFKEVMGMKTDNENKKNAFLRFIQAARHWNYLEKMLKTEHKGSECKSCGLKPLAGCYWKTDIRSKDKYCYKCYVRGYPGTNGKIPAMTHISFKGVTAGAADALFWNEGN